VKKLIPILFVVLICADVRASVTITADNPNIQYTGRIDFSNALAPILSWSGSSVIANFQGTSIQATLNDMGTNYFYAIIDNGTPILITCTAGQHTYSIASGLSDTTHKIELYKRTEGTNGPVAFIAFILDNGKTLTEPPARPIRKIEFYGDSITAGLSLDAPDENLAAVNTNSYLAYGSITARNLNAEHHTIAVSGVGLIITWSYVNMPKDYYYRLNATNASSNWDFNQWTPDCIVINLGQNDRYHSATQSDAVTGYVVFVNLLRTRYSDMASKNIPIILVLGSMDATRAGSPWPGYIQQAIDSLKNTYSDNNVYTTIFPFDGLWTHPHAPQHAANAQQLTNFIIANIPGFSLHTGDISNDGIIDFLDFAMLANHWLETDCGPCAGADLSGDNNVTMADVGIFAENWLKDYRN
jgi:hypothetical protein